MISILTPSRSRPQLAQRMFESAKATAATDIEIKFFLNVDDPLLEEYKKFLPPENYIVGPNQSTSYSWNLMAESARYEILFLVGDDCQFQQSHWDKIILSVFDQYPDKIVCVYPKVPNLSSKKNPHFCLHKNWINTLGFFLPPFFYHWYVDTYIRAVAQRIGRFHCISNLELSIEAVKDEVTSAYHNSWNRQRDDWIWNKVERYIEADANALNKFILDFKKSR